MTLVSDIDRNQLRQLLFRFQLNIIWVEPDLTIPGSFWGDPEAGLIGDQLYLRDDTPLHSALHEACHYICMDKIRRETLHTTSGGDYNEENAVCYLQIVLSDYINGFDRNQMFCDMDSWGYSFRLGSASNWFSHDAMDAKDWLLTNGLITSDEKSTWMLRN